MYGRRKPDRPLVSRRRRRGWLNPWLVTGVAVALVAGVGGIAFARTGSSGIAIGPFGEPFHAGRFVFRCLAGLYFALLFQFRGFGVAAGAHACYDVMVGIAVV